MFREQQRWWRNVVLPSNPSRSRIPVHSFNTLVCFATHFFVDESSPHSFGLLDITKLKDLNPKWTTTTLQTFTLNHTNLRQISVYVPDLFDGGEGFYCVGESTNTEWLEFDRLLAKLWEPHLVRLEVRYVVPGWVDTEGTRSSMEKILPEAAVKGTADPVESGIRQIRDL